MKGRPIPAEVFPPGEFIFDEMEARGWTVEKLSQQAVMPVEEIEVLLNNGAVTGHRAERLSVAFGSSAQYWANLWMAWKKYGKPKEMP